MDGFVFMVVDRTLPARSRSVELKGALLPGRRADARSARGSAQA